MKIAIITELAESDLIKIWTYIARDKPEAADRFIDRLRSECDKLANLPDLGRSRPELASGIYSFAVGRYLIFYFPTDSGIEIARVLHELPVICRGCFDFETRILLQSASGRWRPVYFEPDNEISAT